MKIRTRITLQFTVIVSVILIVFAIAIYFFSANHREEEFYTRLRDKAATTVKLLSDVDEVDNKLLKIIDKNSLNVLPEERILIYDYKNKLVYNSPDDNKDTSNIHVLQRIRSDKEIKYHDGKSEAVGILFEGKYDKYFVIAKAFDKYGLSKLSYLGYLLLSGVIITIVMVVLIGLFFSRQALSPISGMVSQIDNITISNLGLRVNEGNGSDEIAQLAIKFNKMLERLDAAFEVQRSFVSNASHELRTPLTALTGQLEVALMKKEDSDPWQVLTLLLNDIKQLNKLSNGLLDLAQANLDISEIKIETLRIDELIGNARADLLKRNKDYKLNLNFKDFPEDENWLKLKANEQLLKSAILNIMENACKYSLDKMAIIDLDFNKQNINISISDKGIGIIESDLQNIFEPFFRSGNAKNYSGHGIGLTLTKKIVDLHKGKINVRSRLNYGTTMSIQIPHL